MLKLIFIIINIKKNEFRFIFNKMKYFITVIYFHILKINFN